MKRLSEASGEIRGTESKAEGRRYVNWEKGREVLFVEHVPLLHL